MALCESPESMRKKKDHGIENWPHRWCENQGTKRDSVRLSASGHHHPPGRGRWENLTAVTPHWCQCQVVGAETPEKLLADRKVSKSEEEGGTDVFLLLAVQSPARWKPGRSQQAQEPGKQSLCTKALLFWGPRACKGATGEQPGRGPTCMATFRWMSENTSGSGALALRQCSSFHTDSGGARVT